MQPIRLNVNAAIIRNDHILLIEFGEEPHYNLPGGGLDPGESIEEGLKRECREEACAEVEVERLLMVWEYVPEKEDFRFGDRHKVGMIFLCRLQPGSEPHLPETPDENQVAVRWLPLADLQKAPGPGRHPLLPAMEKPLLEALRENLTIGKVWS